MRGSGGGSTCARVGDDAGPPGDDGAAAITDTERTRSFIGGCMTDKKLPFHVVYASGEDDQYPASELNVHSSKVCTRGEHCRTGVCPRPGRPPRGWAVCV